MNRMGNISTHLHHQETDISHPRVDRHWTSGKISRALRTRRQYSDQLLLNPVMPQELKGRLDRNIGELTDYIRAGPEPKGGAISLIFFVSSMLFWMTYPE